jgi:hypothetical protein
MSYWLEKEGGCPPGGPKFQGKLEMEILRMHMRKNINCNPHMYRIIELGFILLVVMN